MTVLADVRAHLECMRTAKWLQSYVDEELTPSQAERIAVHLRSCRRCGLEAETYQRLIDAVAGLRPATDPEALDRLVQFADRLDASQAD